MFGDDPSIDGTPSRGGMISFPLGSLGPAALAFSEQRRHAEALRVRIEGSPLLSTIEAEGAAESNGVRLELVAVDAHEAGAVATIRFQPSPTAEVERSPGHPIVEIRDDAGTSYGAGAVIARRLGRGGEGKVYLAPLPPAGATQVTLTVTRFIGLPPLPPPAPTLPFEAEVEGPWEIDLPLGST